MLDLLADHEQLAFERVDIRAIAAAPNENLPNDRFDFPGRVAQPAVVNRHVAPAEQRLSLVLRGLFDQRLNAGCRFNIPGQENHSDPVFPHLW